MNLGMPEMLFIFLMALVIFGPKKLPELARQFGKIMAEFKRATNDFKYQIENEIEQLEIEERQKQREKERAQQLTSGEQTILPPSPPPGAISNSLATGSGYVVEGETRPVTDETSASSEHSTAAAGAHEQAPREPEQLSFNEEPAIDRSHREPNVI
jgi:sec-independent protein translocase protein TatB